MRGAGAGNEKGNFHNDCDGDDDKDENEYKEGGDDDDESSDRDGDVNPIRSISLSLQKKVQLHNRVGLPGWYSASCGASYFCLDSGTDM